jgi:hypothetical protein
VRGRRWGKDDRKMIPSETIPGMGKGEIKENGGGECI